MKRLLTAILAALTLTMGSAFAQDVPFPDIPANHWALDAVAEIADLGIVIGFPDGTFRGNESFTRYQAALVVSRLLDVINENIDAATAMTQEDIASLRNALQELASDVAAQGVRLSSAESAVASLSDDVSANTARLDELEDRLEAASGQDGVDPEVLRDLQNQIASQRVAIDTAQATAEAAEARANEAFDLANQALALARENAESIAAINSLLQLLGDDLEGLEGQLGQQPDDGAPQIMGLEELRGQVQRNTNDIANIREFVILLRRDQVALRDRVAALEASDAIQAAAIADLQERVTAIEENPLGFTGTIEIEYDVVRISPPGAAFTAFDIDRAYGQGLPRERQSFFSSGEAEEDEGNLEEQADFTEAEEGEVTVTPELEFSWNSEFGGTGPLGTEAFSAVITFEFVAGDIFTDEDPTGDGQTDFYLSLDDIRVNYDPVGGDPLTFQYGEEIEVEFTQYVVDTEEIEHDEGFVLTVGAPDFLDFLNPTLTLLYTTDPTDATPSYLRGLRATVSPIEGLTAGFTAVQRAQNAAEHADVNDNNVTTTILGGDLSASLGFLSLDAEYATSNTFDAATDTTVDGGSILYVIAEVNPGEAGIPILESIEANYRDIDEDWFTALDGLNEYDDDAVFEEDQAGFAVFATLDLFILDVSGFYDQYTTVEGNGDTSLAYGVDAMADLPLGFELEAFYHSASFSGVVVDSLEDPVDADENLAGNGADTNRDDNDYETAFGVAIEHDGSADDALINGLNIDASYTQAEADFSETTIEANASYDLEVSIISLSPYVGYESVNDSDDIGEEDYVRLQAGAGLETEPVAMIFRPSLAGNVNYRNTDYTVDGADAYTSTLLQFSVGLNLEQFLFENSELSVNYASYSGTNIQPGSALTGDMTEEDGVEVEGVDDVNLGGARVSVSGYEIVWNYSGLEMGYGVYVEDSDTGVDGNENVAQAFSISYTVAF